MGLFDYKLLKRSFHLNQPQLDSLIREYEAMGFNRAHISKAWQRCKQNAAMFHDELILVSNEENAKIMSQQDLMSSQHALRNNIKQKEDDEIRKAIQLSLGEEMPENLEELKQLLRKDTASLPGLKNLGNTCYMNVMLQAVFNIKDFRNLILDLKIDAQTDDGGKLMILRLQELFALQLKGNRTYVNPQAFFEAMARFKPNTMLVRGVQNDYYELWAAFLDSIESGLKKVFDIVTPKQEDNVDLAKNIEINPNHLVQEQPKEQMEKPVVEKHPVMEQLKSIFYGASEETLTYLEKDNEVKRFTETSFGVINLDSKDGEIYKAFKKCQQLKIDEYISDGGTKTKATIDVKILEPPKVLSFYINRVDYDTKQNKVKKNNNMFQFPERLNLNLYYKDPNETTKYNKNIQERLDKLYSDEQECFENLRLCGDQDDTESNSTFDLVIKLLKKTEGALEKSLTSDDFIIFDEDSSVQGDMIGPNELISQLERYKKLISKRKKLYTQKLEHIQQEKKLLLDDKQNVYCLTSVIIHDGTADSGHYISFVYNKSLGRWIKCNDRTTTLVDFDTVYRAATGKIVSQMNVSGLIYEEENWMQSVEAKKVQFSPFLEEYVEFQNKDLLKKMDEQYLNTAVGRIQMRMSQLFQRTQTRLRNFAQSDEFIYLLRCFADFDIFMFQQPQQDFQYHALQLAMQLEKQDVQQSLNFPESFDQYVKIFVQNNASKFQFKDKVQELEKNYIYLMAFYQQVSKVLQNYSLQLQVEITPTNYNQIVDVQKEAVNKIYLLLESNKNQIQLNKFLLQLRSILEATYLKGCFFCDLHVQKQDIQVFDLIKYILNSLENTLTQSTLIKQQICNNIDSTLQKIKESRWKKDDSLIKALNERLQSVMKNEQKQIKVNLPNNASNDLAFVDLDQLTNKYLHLSSKQLKVWLQFINKVEQTKKVIPQSERLNEEEILYFQFMQ